LRDRHRPRGRFGSVVVDARTLWRGRAAAGGCRCAYRTTHAGVGSGAAVALAGEARRRGAGPGATAPRASRRTLPPTRRPTRSWPLARTAGPRPGFYGQVRPVGSGLNRGASAPRARGAAKSAQLLFL